MDRVGYDGYIICPRPYQLAEVGRWSTNVEIWRDDGDSVTVVPFSAANSYESKELATLHSLDFGRQIIDGDVPGCAAP
jgi:hypothetical protein